MRPYTYTAKRYAYTYTTTMMPAPGESPNLDVVGGARDERKAVYGYVYEYVYGEKRGIRTSASSRRLESGAAYAPRSDGMKPYTYTAKRYTYPHTKGRR
jgi:hypothetical protein